MILCNEEDNRSTLAEWLVAISATPPPVDDVEGKYVAKLDTMLGGLVARE